MGDRGTKGVAGSNVRVPANGTTFAGTYEVVGDGVGPPCADLGEQSAEGAGRDPRAVADDMLRMRAEQAWRNRGVPFLRDGGSVPTAARGG